MTKLIVVFQNFANAPKKTGCASVFYGRYVKTFGVKLPASSSVVLWFGREVTTFRRYVLP
jgi:hypothetical protein